MAGSFGLMPGTLDLMVLRALAGEFMHGYGVAEWIRRQTEDEFVLEEAALYKALHRLEHQGLLESEWGVSENNRRAKFYHLTPPGEARLRQQMEDWRRYAVTIGRLLEGWS